MSQLDVLEEPAVPRRRRVKEKNRCHFSGDFGLKGKIREECPSTQVKQQQKIPAAAAGVVSHQ